LLQRDVEVDKWIGTNRRPDGMPDLGERRALREDSFGYRAGMQRRQGRGRQQAGNDRQPGGFQRLLGVTHERGDHGRDPFGRIQDDRPIAVPDGHPALHFQGNQRLGKRRSADAQFDGQFAFRW